MNGETRKTEWGKQSSVGGNKLQNLFRNLKSVIVANIIQRETKVFEVVSSPQNIRFVI